MFSQVEEIIKSWFLIDVIALSYERTDERHDKVLIRFFDTPIQYLIFFNENVQTTIWELQRTYYGNQFIWVHSVDLTALNGSFFQRHKQISYADLLGFEDNSKKERDGLAQQHLKLEIEMVTKSAELEISDDETAASIAAIERLEIRPATSSTIFDEERIKRLTNAIKVIGGRNTELFTGSLSPNSSQNKSPTAPDATSAYEDRVYLKHLIWCHIMGVCDLEEIENAVLVYEHGAVNAVRNLLSRYGEIFSYNDNCAFNLHEKPMTRYS
tara:strand:+ start:371 stop:1177 length:807 start_codon:yes stop_codon:yes gene_type:complete